MSMRVENLTLVLCLCIVSSAIGQNSSGTAQQPAGSGLVRLAEPSVAPEPVPAQLTSHPAPTVMESPSSLQWGTAPLPYSSETVSMNSDRLAFNAGLPVSKLLVNPDQFWARKAKPVLDQRNVHLFGDPAQACDEWKGVCGCCGIKSNPGHLGIKSLRSGDPCECVDDCCPPARCEKCKRHQCR
jgi:hypothetical protein